MTSLRAGIVASVAALITATTATSCGGSRPARPAIGSVPLARTSSTALEGATAIAPAGGLRRALAAMPADYEVVFALDAARLRASPLFAHHEAMLRQALGSTLRSIQDDCGLDLLEGASGILLGGKGPSLEDGTAFLTGFDRAQVTQCLDRRAASDRSAGTRPHLLVDGDYAEYGAGADALRVLLLAPRSVLWIKHGDELAGAPELRAAAAARDGAGLTGSRAFLDLLARTRTDAGMWFIIGGNSPLVGVGGLADATSVRGSFDAGEIVTGEIRLGMRDEAAAMATADAGRKSLAQLTGSPFGAMFRDVHIAAERTEVVIAMTFDRAQLDQLTATLGQLGGGP